MLGIEWWGLRRDDGGCGITAFFQIAVYIGAEDRLSRLMVWGRLQHELQMLLLLEVTESSPSPQLNVVAGCKDG